MFGSLKTKFTSFQIPDEAAALRNFCREMRMASTMISAVYLASTRYAEAVYKRGMPSKQYGYEHAPTFFLGILLPGTCEAKLAEVFDMNAHHKDIKNITLPALLANPIDDIDDNIFRFSRHSIFRSKSYKVDFMPAPVVKQIIDQHGMNALKALMR